MQKISVSLIIMSAYINVFLKLFDFAFESLHICDEVDSVRGAGCVHRVLL